MKLAQFVFAGILLHLAVTTPAHNDNNQDEIPIAFDNNQDPQLWQKSGKVEGDMALTTEQLELLHGTHRNRNGVIDTRLYWPNRRIPYKLSNDFTAAEKNYITTVLNEDYARSCVRVVARTNETDYVYVTGQNTGCWSNIGRLGGRQELNLQRDGCIYYATIVHQFLHAAGFYHQHSATNRDDYVRIQMGNIKSGQEHNFDKYYEDVISSFKQRVKGLPWLAQKCSNEIFLPKSEFRFT